MGFEIRYRSAAALALGLAFSASGSATSCTPAYSMYQTRVASDRTRLNERNLDKLRERKQVPSTKDSFKVGVLTDTHSDYEDFEKTVDLLNARKDIDFVVLVGDFTNVGMIWEYNQAYEVMRKLRHPLVTVMGNHDAVAFGREIYRDMFGPATFSFQHKQVRFVAWQNAVLEYGRKGMDFGSLEKELAKKGDEATTVVISHIPPTEPESQIFSSGEKKKFHAILEKNDVKLSLHGHRHAFGWLHVTGAKGVDYVTANRVRGVNYGVLNFKGGTFGYEWCKASGCAVMDRESTLETWQ